ncbi:RNA polymerase subunit sigma-24 [Frankia sp. Cj5]|uniref:RNA polymerase subunit sigma-24 n=1 Tax=Frankia sp. Cj5 TaxID=2880978 RepID=UPI001EF59CC1|nr:RNA polymerase subunit sigma-24 [Frankia sp. Cj5]
MNGGIRRTDPADVSATGPSLDRSAVAPTARDAQDRPRTPLPRTPESDIDLVMRIRRGERDAFDDVYEQYADDVFSMCLLILGEAEVAQAAAGTAFALVARTRLGALGEPTRLRSWLLELARGSALAWSGSPQARGGPVRHAAAPEEMLAKTQLTPAPRGLREGLVRTFDRAATALGSPVPSVPPHASSMPDTSMPAPMSASIPASMPAPMSAPMPDTPVPDTPAGSARGTSADHTDEPGSVAHPDGVARPPDERRGRPMVTLAASLLLAVAGVTAAINWPTTAEVSPRYPDVAFGPPAPGPLVTGRHRPDTISPTVAGAFTRRVPGQRTVPTMLEVASANEMILVAQRSTAELARPQAVPEPSPPTMVNVLPRSTATLPTVTASSSMGNSATHVPPVEVPSASPATQMPSTAPSATPDADTTTPSVLTSGTPPQA